ncbi:DUF4426 domain-containing protein [Halomonas vilamensis]|uniref:DUF4426 domain-containing protein n=1 Tax=Vreelandella vilamensis TaxID=531309 RepID=A0ABU1H4V1_9GAMM|nr:DUF4426 domain-containing protein [Halomonas vilamensis]MDR5899333.1 DUF4426 domain-containing protein [Halomonas vilamensis]
MLKRALLATFAVVGLSLTGLSAHAEQYTQVGDYQIHYSAVSTRFLTPETAQAYNLQRSAGLGLVNVSVRETQEDGSTRPVNASVQGSVGDLAGNRESISFRTVHEDDAIYHLATFTLRDDESMRFELDVKYDRNAEPEPVNFTQRFYIER